MRKTLHLFALIKMCFLLLSVYFQVQVVTACSSSGGNGSSFDNSNVCYLSLVSFHFCCIGSVKTLYSFSVLCSTSIVLPASFCLFLKVFLLLFPVRACSSFHFKTL